jgi:hypothetical protein
MAHPAYFGGPVQKALLERLRVRSPEKTAENVMGWCASITEVTVTLKPAQALFGEVIDLGEVLAIGHHSGQGKEDQGGQRVVKGMVNPGVL